MRELNWEGFRLMVILDGSDALNVFFWGLVDVVD